MDKLAAIRIYDGQNYSDEIPVTALAENIQWDESSTLIDILGSINLTRKGNIQDQIDELNNRINQETYSKPIDGIPKTDLANSVSNPAMSGSTLNAHSTLLGHEQNYVNQVTSEANLVDKCADVLDIAEKMQISSGQLGNSSVSWTGPIIAAVSGFIGRIRSAHKDRNTIKENQEIEQELQTIHKKI